MTAPAFRSTVAWEPERVGALAIYCSDGRWGEAFDEFCHRELGIPRYDRFAVPGGPVWLTLRDVSLLKLYSVARDEIGFLVRAHDLGRIVLIGHYGCAVYRRLLGRDPDDCLARQEEDLRGGAQTLRGWFAGIRVEGYMARYSGTEVYFTAVDTG